MLRPLSLWRWRWRLLLRRWRTVLRFLYVAARRRSYRGRCRRHILLLLRWRWRRHVRHLSRMLWLRVVLLSLRLHWRRHIVATIIDLRWRRWRLVIMMALLRMKVMCRQRGCVLDRHGDEISSHRGVSRRRRRATLRVTRLHRHHRLLLSAMLLPVLLQWLLIHQ